MSRDAKILGQNITTLKEAREESISSTCYYLPYQNIEIKSTCYNSNSEQSVIRFFPSNVNWGKKLNSTEYFFSCLFPSGGLYFKGQISIERFLEAMRQALQDFNFLFCRFKSTSTGLYTGYSADEKDEYFLQLEIEKQNKSFNTISFSSILPNKIDERIRNGATEHLENLPMAIIKLTTLKDGFVLGYYFNHAFFDQSSIVYFFQYISRLYSFGRKNSLLINPVLVDLDSVETKQHLNLKNLTGLRASGEDLMGFLYTPKKVENTFSLLKFDQRIILNINFYIDSIDKFKHQEENYISSNDVIHALLLKIYSFNPNIRLDDYFCLGFPCNMRKRCGLGNEVIGNVVGHSRLLLKVENIKNASVLELAILNRMATSKINVEDFKKNLEWYKYFQKSKEISFCYMPSFNLLNCRVTNWSTFDYDNISFDKSTPIILNGPSYAQYGVNIISFDNSNTRKILKTSICIPLKILYKIKELGKNTSLFHCEKFYKI